MVVLQHLKKVGVATAKQIGRSLRVTAMAVRQHLAALERAGLLATTLERRRAGRPSYLYSLTDHAEPFFPNEYAQFAARLLQVIAELDGEAKTAVVFARMKEMAVARYRPRMAGKDLEERVAELTRIQSESGYMAEWRQRGNAFEVCEHNCAILQVSRNHPEACDCELKMIQQLLGTAVIRDKHIAQGDACCRYLIDPLGKSPRKANRTKAAKLSSSAPMRSAQRRVTNIRLGA